MYCICYPIEKTNCKELKITLFYVVFVFVEGVSVLCTETMHYTGANTHWVFAWYVCKNSHVSSGTFCSVELILNIHEKLYMYGAEKNISQIPTCFPCTALNSQTRERIKHWSPELRFHGNFKFEKSKIYVCIVHAVLDYCMVGTERVRPFIVYYSQKNRFPPKRNFPTRYYLTSISCVHCVWSFLQLAKMTSYRIGIFIPLQYASY